MKTGNQKSRERGTAVVEFSLIIPILLAFLMGTIEFGLLFYNKQVLTNASREGARAGIAKLTASEVETIVNDYCNDRLIRFGSAVNPVTTVTGALGAYGTDLTVHVTYDYTFLAPGLIGLGPTLQLNTETVMSMELEL